MSAVVSPGGFNPSGTLSGHHSGIWPKIVPAFGQFQEEAIGCFTAILEADKSIQKHLILLLFYTFEGLISCKALIINTIQHTVRRSFSAPNASQQCGAFLFIVLPLRGSALIATEVLENKQLTKNLVPNLHFLGGVGHQPFYNYLTANN